MNLKLTRRSFLAIIFIIVITVITFFLNPHPKTIKIDEIKTLFRSESSDDFSFIVLPDTQWYTHKYPEILLAQMNWIKDFGSEINTKAVITLGDITQEHDKNEIEWQRADEAYAILDGMNIPYNVLPGNHDISKTEGATKFFNQYFPPERFSMNDWYGGNYDGTNRNNYITIDAGETEFILVSLEYCPPKDAVVWAREIFAQYPEKIGILATHAYLNEKGVRSEGCTRSTRLGDQSGEDMWQEIVVPSENIQLVMNGHFHDEQGGTYLVSHVDDRTIHQIMSNYQDFKNGGNGFLRIMNFVIQDDLVQVRTYSPFIDEFIVDEVNTFEFTLDKLR